MNQQVTGSDHSVEVDDGVWQSSSLSVFKEDTAWSLTSIPC